MSLESGNNLESLNAQRAVVDEVFRGFLVEKLEGKDGKGATLDNSISKHDDCKSKDDDSAQSSKSHKHKHKKHKKSKSHQKKKHKHDTSDEDSADGKRLDDTGRTGDKSRGLQEVGDESSKEKTKLLQEDSNQSGTKSCVTRDDDTSDKKHKKHKKHKNRQRSQSSDLQPKKDKSHKSSKQHMATSCGANEGKERFDKDGDNSLSHGRPDVVLDNGGDKQSESCPESHDRENTSKEMNKSSEKQNIDLHKDKPDQRAVKRQSRECSSDSGQSKTREESKSGSPDKYDDLHRDIKVFKSTQRRSCSHHSENRDDRRSTKRRSRERSDDLHHIRERPTRRSRERSSHSSQSRDQDDCKSSQQRSRDRSANSRRSGGRDGRKSSRKRSRERSAHSRHSRDRDNRKSSRNRSRECSHSRDRANPKSSRKKSRERSIDSSHSRDRNDHKSARKKSRERSTSYSKNSHKSKTDVRISNKRKSRDNSDDSCSSLNRHRNPKQKRYEHTFDKSDVDLTPLLKDSMEDILHKRLTSTMKKGKELQAEKEKTITNQSADVILIDDEIVTSTIKKGKELRAERENIASTQSSDVILIDDEIKTSIDIPLLSPTNKELERFSDISGLTNPLPLEAVLKPEPSVTVVSNCIEPSSGTLKPEQTMAFQPAISIIASLAPKIETLLPPSSGQTAPKLATTGIFVTKKPLLKMGLKISESSAALISSGVNMVKVETEYNAASLTACTDGNNYLSFFILINFFPSSSS